MGNDQALPQEVIHLRPLANRLPGKREIMLVFLVCAFPIHLWAWVVFLYKIPSYLLYMSLGQILGILSYSMTLALLESALLTLLPVILAFVLPRRLFLDYFVSQSTVLVLALSGWAAVVHFLGISTNPGTSIFGTVLSYKWPILFLILFTGFSALLRILPRFNALVVNFVDRLSLLSGFYIFIDLIGLCIVLGRNLVLILL